MKLDPSEACSKNQCGSITINYGEYVVEHEFRSCDV
jgi:hypothetical protein